ncbi:hypothetical protein J6590_073570 [Homalodisca vitripennis]|nr:hypothetical protein J6590_073570 [Homalodisca vitripennis]
MGSDSDNIQVTRHKSPNTVTYVHLKSPDEVMTGAQKHDYNTRYAANYHLPAHHLASTQKKPTYVGAKLWNALPLELKRRDRLQFGH